MRGAGSGRPSEMPSESFAPHDAAGEEIALIPQDFSTLTHTDLAASLGPRRSAGTVPALPHRCLASIPQRIACRNSSAFFTLTRLCQASMCSRTALNEIWIASAICFGVQRLTGRIATRFPCGVK